MTDGPEDPSADVDVGDPLHIPSPEEGVSILADLLDRHDWETLARYYDLSAVDDAEEVGVNVNEWPTPDPSWFTNEPAPHVAIAPTLHVIYHHPFPPTFEYVDHEVNGDVATVVVEGTWDPGGDVERQEGRWAFELRRHGDGWQVLPHAVDVLEGDDP